jgi:hypothetical protein
MPYTLYATTSQFMSLLKRQNLSLTNEQIRSSSFVDEDGNTLKIRKGIVDEVAEFANSFFSPNNAKRVLSALQKLELAGRGRPSNSRERFLLEGTRCYVVNTQSRTTVPTGDFFQLEHGSKVTARFVDNGGESYIKITPHD